MHNTMCNQRVNSQSYSTFHIYNREHALDWNSPKIGGQPKLHRIIGVSDWN